MTLAHRIRVFALAILAATFVAGTAKAQSIPSAVGPFAVDGYYSHYRLDAVGNDAVGMNGLGARVTWYPWRGTVSSDHAARLQSRVGLGLFGEYAPAQDRGFSMFHTGVHGDVSLLSTPLLGHVSPVASLGLGVLRTNLDNASQAAATGFPLGMRARPRSRSRRPSAPASASGGNLASAPMPATSSRSAVTRATTCS